jgi:DNA-binding NtrC family response regulator
MTSGRILLVDDDPSVQFAVGEFLRGHHFHVGHAESCSAGVGALAGPERYDAAVLDYALPDGTALDMLRELGILRVTTPVVVLTGHGSIELAVEAIKQGAQHFLTKPVQLDSLLVVIQRTLEQARHRRHGVAAQRSARVSNAVDPFVGRSRAIQQLVKNARRVAASDVPVLIQGETGAGKGVLARWIHRTGARSLEPWVEVNCATLPRELLESELFGHERGAFTGAVSGKVGLIESADRGVVFLDEIGDMDVALQPKLLKVLEERRFRRIGDIRERHADVRFIAASHQDLQVAVERKQFRMDLLFRLNALTLTVPPLRERTDDIPLLVEQFLERTAHDYRRAPLTLTPAAMDALRRYSWPGNVRELYNVLERASILSDGTVLGPEALRLDQSRPEPQPRDDTAGMTLEQLQIRHIQRVLETEGGNIGRVAMRLGVPRSTLYQRINKYGLRPTSV